MAKKKKEEVVEETTKEQVVEETTVEEKTPKIDLSKFESKDDETVTKVDLSKPVEKTPVQEETVQEETDEEKPVEEITKTAPEETVDTPVVEEITDEVVEETEKIEEVAEEAIKESIETGKELPENIQKLVDFIEETGGDIQDYVKLNQDFTDWDNESLLLEYYKSTKPHLSLEEINFLMDDKFSFNEEEDTEREVKRKKLALKEQVADARNHLDGLKSKYYEDIKAGSKLTTDQQKAINFFNRYDKESKENQKIVDKQHSTFMQKTNEVFNNKFKGFEYEVGDKRFRFNVKNGNEVKETQSDMNNFVKKFLNKKNEMSNAKDYHKSLFTAMNPDTIANHFYEQGKADALKNSVAKSKNISMDPRQQHSGEIDAGGIKVRVLGDNSNDFKFKIKNKQ